MPLARHPLFTFVLALLGRIAPAIAGVRVLEPKEWRAAMRWMRDAAALLRRGLLAQAVLLAAGMKKTKRLVWPLPHHLMEAERTPCDAPAPAGVFAVPLGVRRDEHDRRPGQRTRPRTPPAFLTAPIAHRIALMRAAMEHPDPLVRRLARRIARRYMDLPRMLRRMGRYRPHAALAGALGPIFREPPEMFIGEMERIASGLDPPAHLRLVAETIPPFRPEAETMAHACTPPIREYAGESRQVALGAGPFFTSARRRYS